MAGSVNRAIIIGNLGKDPDCRRTSDGKPVVSFSVATSETWRDKTTGERRERTEWHKVTIWHEGLCKIAEQYLKKGSKVYVSGQLQTRKWQDKEGIERYTTEIVLQGFNAEMQLLDSKPNGAGEETAQAYGDHEDPAPRRTGAQGARADMDDEIPFMPEVR